MVCVCVCACLLVVILSGKSFCIAIEYVVLFVMHSYSVMTASTISTEGNNQCIMLEPGTIPKRETM